MPPRVNRRTARIGVWGLMVASIFPIAVSTPALLLDELSPATKRQLIPFAVIGWGMLLASIWALWRERTSKGP